MRHRYTTTLGAIQRRTEFRSIHVWMCVFSVVWRSFCTRPKSTIILNGSGHTCSSQWAVMRANFERRKTWLRSSAQLAQESNGPMVQSFFVEVVLHAAQNTQSLSHSSPKLAAVDGQVAARRAIFWLLIHVGQEQAGLSRPAGRPPSQL